MVVPGTLIVGVGCSSLGLAEGNQLHYVVEISLLSVAVFVPLTFLVLRPDASRPERWLLTNPVTAWLGTISYSLYLWHIAVLIFVGRHITPVTDEIGDPGLRFVVIYLITVAITAVIATASYWCIERPFIKLGRRATAGRRQAATVPA